MIIHVRTLDIRAHRHSGGIEHRHWHEHQQDSWHPVEGNLAIAPPLHEHKQETSSRTALLLILGSSQMVEGIPTFFAASRYGISLLILMGELWRSPRL